MLREVKNKALYVRVRKNDETKYIPIEDIIYFKAECNYTSFVLANGTSFITSKTLKIYNELFGENLFYRVHNSYLVNRKQITGISTNNGYSVQLKTGISLPVSLRRKAMLASVLKSSASIIC